MAKKKAQIPKYGTITLKGIQYYRTRITDADGKELSLYAATCEELYEKQLEARKQVEEIIFHRQHPTVSDYVIADSKGEPLAASQFQRVWQYVVVRSTKPRNYYKYVNGESIKYTVTPTLGMTQKNQPKIKYTLDFDVTPHQLRHTYITNLLYAGVDPKTVQYLAGHENSKTTMDIYAKVKYNKPEELFGVVNGAFHQPVAE